MRKCGWALGILTAGLVLIFSGCQGQKISAEPTEIQLTEEAPEDEADNQNGGQEKVRRQEMVVVKKEQLEPEHMELYASCPFVYDGKEWELQILVQEDMLVNGELALDDRGHFMIRAISGEDSYILFDETVQLGMPDADVWTDEEEKLHIVLRDVRTARYRVTDFVYDREKEKFLGSHVIDGEGINYLGTTSGQ